MIKVIEMRQQELLVSLIANHDPNEHLRGLQDLCREIENGRRLITANAFSHLIMGHFFSPIPKIRRWAFYSAQLMGLTQAVPPLEFALEVENDEECRLWAWNAYTNLADIDGIQRVIHKPNFQYSGTNLELIDITKSGIRLQQKSIISWQEITDNPISARFAGISFGYEASSPKLNGSLLMDKSLVQQLQMHEDISVAEYAIWAFFQRKDGTSHDLLIPVDELDKKSPGIRGWGYRLLLKDFIDPAKEEFLYQSIAKELDKTDVPARRGLARAIRSVYWEGMENLVLHWIHEESEKSIKNALLEHCVYHHYLCREYEGYILDTYYLHEERSLERLTIDTAIRRIDAEHREKLIKQLRLLGRYDNSRGDIVMGDKFNFDNIENINAEMVNFGKVRKMAIDSLDQADHRHLVSPIREDLARFIELVSSDDQISEKKKTEVVESIAEVSSADSSKLKNAASKAISKIEDIASAAKSSSEIAKSAQKIIEIFQNS